MRHATSVMLAVLSALTISFIMSAVASAESTNNPQWSLCVELGANEGGFKDKNCTEKDAAKKSKFELTILGETGTGELEASAKTSQVLKPSVGGATIICKALKLAAGATIKGSNAPKPGTSAETIEYKECEVSGSPECKINKEESKKAKLTTNPLKNTLAFETKEAAKNEVAPTVTIFEPVTGKIFIEFELSGTCPVTGKVKVEGSVEAQNPEGEKHKESHILVAPEGGLTKYFVNPGAEERKAEVKAFGVKATYVGESTVIVKSGGANDIWGIFN